MVGDRELWAEARAPTALELQRAAAESDFQHGGAPGRQGDAVFGDVARFDANHLFEFFVAEIGHLLRLGRPWIPDDRGSGAGFIDADFAAELAVMDFDRGGGVEKNAVDLGGDPDQVA